MNTSIKDCFELPLKSAGFKKKGDSWYRDCEDAILVVNLQKSNYGEQYYVNLAIWIKQLGSISFPKENLCHIRIRLDSLVDEDLRTVFDCDNSSMTDAERRLAVESAMIEKAIPFLLSFESWKGIARMLQRPELKKALIHKEAKALLQLI